MTENPLEMVENIFKHVTRISAQKAPEGVIGELAEMAREITGADRCSVWVVSDDAQTLWTYMADGIETIRVPYGAGIVGYAISECKRMIINDAYADPRFNPAIDQQTGYVTRNMMVVPMVTEDGRVVGAFQLVNKLPEGSRFDEEHLKYVMVASLYAAETVHGALRGHEDSHG